MRQIIESFNDFLWGLPLILGIMGTGIYISIRLGGIQFRKLGFALRNTLGKVFEPVSYTHLETKQSFFTR